MKKSRYGEYYRAKEFQRKRDLEWIPQIREMERNTYELYYKQLCEAYYILGLTPPRSWIEHSKIYEDPDVSKYEHIQLDFDIKDKILDFTKDSE